VGVGLVAVFGLRSEDSASRLRVFKEEFVMFRAILALAVSSFIVANVSGDPIPKKSGNDKFYCATTVGTKWVYTDWDRESEEEILDVKDGPYGAKDVIIGHKIGGRILTADVTRVSEKGLSHSVTMFGELDEEYWLLKLPTANYQKWSPVLACKDLFEIKCEAVASKPEKVLVPAGEFMAIRVEMSVAHGIGTDKPFKVTTWYAPNVGKIKQIHSLREGIEVLKSFTHGKDKK
jgi:hypothetical protein